MQNPTRLPTQLFFTYFPELAAALIIVVCVLKYSPYNNWESVVFWVLFILAISRLIFLLYSGQKKLAILFIAGSLVFMYASKLMLPERHGIQLIDNGPTWVKFNVYFETAQPRRVVVFLSSIDGQWMYPNPISVGQVTTVGENTFFLHFEGIHWDYLQQHRNVDIELRVASYDTNGKEYTHGTIHLPKKGLNTFFNG